MTTATPAGLRRFTASPVQFVAFAVGAVFLLLGVLGFVPGVTTNIESLGSSGPASDAHLFGVFQVSVLHNIVHVALGVAGIALGRAPGAASRYLTWGGALYAGLWLYGLLTDAEGPANFVPLNAADDLLHFVLAAVMIALGLVLPRSRAGVAAAARAR